MFEFWACFATTSSVSSSVKCNGGDALHHTFQSISLDLFGFNSNTIEHVSPFVLGFSSFRLTVVAWSGQLGPRSLGFWPVRFGTWSSTRCYKLPLFGHGPGHILVYIAASVVAAATGLFLAYITRNLCQGPCVRSVARTRITTDSRWVDRVGGAHIKLIPCKILRRNSMYTNKQVALHAHYI